MASSLRRSPYASDGNRLREAEHNVFDMQRGQRNRGAFRRPSGVVLLASHSEDMAATVAEMLEPSGYVLLRAPTGREALRQAAELDPDAVLVDASLPDVPGVEVCRALRAHPGITSSTALILLSSSPPSAELLIDALRAGAWDALGQPFEPGALPLKLDTYVRARVDAEHARETGLLDPVTGLYNRQGLARRARELGSQAFRQHTALACVVLTLDVQGEAAEHKDHALPGAIDRFAGSLRQNARLSDAIGRLGPADFAVLAPATDARGAAIIAARLAKSLQAAAEEAGFPAPATRVRAGYDAVSNLTYAPADPVELLSHAIFAARQAKPAPESRRIRQFDPGALG
jgi:diguanylate cyclase (GGDEF)-like protein